MRRGHGAGGCTATSLMHPGFPLVLLGVFDFLPRLFLPFLLVLFFLLVLLAVFLLLFRYPDLAAKARGVNNKKYC